MIKAKKIEWDKENRGHLGGYIVFDIDILKEMYHVNPNNLPTKKKYLLSVYLTDADSEYCSTIKEAKQKAQEILDKFVNEIAKEVE